MTGSPRTWAWIRVPRSDACTPSSCGRIRPWTGPRRGPWPSSGVCRPVRPASWDRPARRARAPAPGSRRRGRRSSSRPYVAARRAVALSGWCRARPGSGRPGWRRRSPRRARTAGTVVAVGRTNETSDGTPYWPWAQVLRNLPGIPGDGPAGVVMGRTGTAGGPPSRRRPCTTRWRTSSSPRRAGPAPCWSCSRTSTGPTRRACCSCRRWPGGSVTPRSCCCAPTAWRTRRRQERSARCSRGSHGRRPPNASACPGCPRRRRATCLPYVWAGQPDEALAARAAARTGGNPFFLQELARLVRDSHAPAPGLGRHPRDGPRRPHPPAEPAADPGPAVARRRSGGGEGLRARPARGGLGADPGRVDAGLAAAVASGLAVEVGSPAPGAPLPSTR